MSGQSMATGSNSMHDNDFTKTALPPGTNIIIEHDQARDGSRTANARDIKFASGRNLFLSSTGSSFPDDKQ